MANHGFGDDVRLLASSDTEYLYADLNESKPGLIEPFRRASIRVSAVFDTGYGSSAAGLVLALEGSDNGTDWFTTTIHDRLAVPPDPLTDDQDAIVGAQDIQAAAITIDADMQAEVADTVNHFAHFRLALVNATIPCVLSAWLHTQ